MRGPEPQPPPLVEPEPADGYVLVWRRRYFGPFASLTEATAWCVAHPGVRGSIEPMHLSVSGDLP